MKLPPAITHTATRIHAAQTRRLHNLRFSFITTPQRLYHAFSTSDPDAQLFYHPKPTPQSQWILAACILGSILGLALCVGGTLAVGYGLAAFDAAAVRFRRPEVGGVVSWSAVVGVLCGAVAWAGVTTAEELELGTAETLGWIAAGVGVLLVSLVVGVVGMVFVVAWWKMAVGVWRGLYWPAGLDEHSDT